MKIWLRIDDRFIHGQVLVGWVQVLGLDGIIVANKAFLFDEVRRRFLRNIVPNHIFLDFVAPENVMESLRRAQEEKKNKILILVGDPFDAMKVLEAGLKVDSINIGGMHYQEGREEIGENVFATQKEVEYLEKISSLRIELDSRAVPLGKKTNFTPVLKEYIRKKLKNSGVSRSGKRG